MKTGRRTGSQQVRHQCKHPKQREPNQELRVKDAPSVDVMRDVGRSEARCFRVLSTISIHPEQNGLRTTNATPEQQRQYHNEF